MILDALHPKIIWDLNIWVLTITWAIELDNLNLILLNVFQVIGEDEDSSYMLQISGL